MPNLLPALPTAPAGTNPESNYQYATACCEVIHYINHTVQDFVLSSELLQTSARSYHRHLLHRVLSSAQADLDKHHSLTEEAGTRLSTFIENESLAQCDSLKAIGNHASECFDLHSELIASADRMTERLADCRKRLERSVETEKLLFDVRRTGAVEQADDQLARLREGLRFLDSTRVDWKADRQQRHLSEDRVLSHRYDKKRLGAICEQANGILKDWCLPGVREVHRHYEVWIKDTDRLVAEVRLLKDDLGKFAAKRGAFLTALDRLLICHHPSATLAADKSPGRQHLGVMHPLSPKRHGMKESSSTGALSSLIAASAFLPNIATVHAEQRMGQLHLQDVPAASKSRTAHLFNASSGGTARPDQPDDYSTAEQEGYLLVTYSGGRKQDDEQIKDCLNFLARNGEHNITKIRDVRQLLKEQGELIQRLNAAPGPAGGRGHAAGVSHS